MSRISAHSLTVSLRAIAACSCFCGVASAGPVYTSFDPPNSEYTFPDSINTAGVVDGSFVGTDGAWHGFVRTTEGSITVFDPAGSAATYVQGANSINDHGTLTGSFSDTAGIEHGFVRTADGTIQTFDERNSTRTHPVSINSKGAITGWFRDAADGNYYGFLRSPAGKIKRFGLAGGTETIPRGLNDAGQIVGHLLPGDVGFLRQRGSDSEFSVPESISTDPYSINAVGDISGKFTDTAGYQHGFVRASTGSITTFDAPGSYTSPYEINAKGTIVGYFEDNSGIDHSFLRTADGTIKRFDPPGTVGGSTAVGINRSETIVGNYEASDTQYHGYIRTK